MAGRLFPRSIPSRNGTWLLQSAEGNATKYTQYPTNAAGLRLRLHTAHSPQPALNAANEAEGVRRVRCVVYQLAFEAQQMLKSLCVCVVVSNDNFCWGATVCEEQEKCPCTAVGPRD